MRVYDDQCTMTKKRGSIWHHMHKDIWHHISVEVNATSMDMILCNKQEDLFLWTKYQIHYFAWPWCCKAHAFGTLGQHVDTPTFKTIGKVIYEFIANKVSNLINVDIERISHTTTNATCSQRAMISILFWLLELGGVCEILFISLLAQ